MMKRTDAATPLTAAEQTRKNDLQPVRACRYCGQPMPSGRLITCGQPACQTAAFADGSGSISQTWQPKGTK